MIPYSSYKDSGVEWIGEIPNHWDSKRLGMVGIFTSSGIDKKTNEDEPSVNMVGDSDKIGHVFRVKTAGSSDANRPPRRSEATLAF